MPYTRPEQRHSRVSCACKWKHPGPRGEESATSVPKTVGKKTLGLSRISPSARGNSHPRLGKAARVNLDYKKTWKDVHSVLAPQGPRCAAAARSGSALWHPHRLPDLCVDLIDDLPLPPLVPRAAPGHVVLH